MASSTSSKESAPDAGALPQHDFEVILAKMIALAARNGVEDLHANGAFSDLQAPALNSRLRGRVYELLIATRHRNSSRRRDPFTAYVDDLAHGYTGSHAAAALQGAIARAVDAPPALWSGPRRHPLPVVAPLRPPTLRAS